MAYGLPVKGQLNYDDELNNSIESVRSDAALAQSTANAANTSANTAKTDATSAVATANQALDFVRTTSDDRVAEHVNDGASATRAALSATYGADATHLAPGTLAARPAANTVPAGSLYPATDTGLIYRSDGATWSTWGTHPSHAGIAGAGVAAYHTAAASIPNNTTTVIALGGEDFDTNGYHDNITNPSRLTIPAGLGGKYDVFPQVSFGYNTAGTRAVILMKNGVEILNLGWNPTISSMGLASTAVALAAGDYLELATWQNSGAAMTLNNTTTRLTILRLGD